MSVHYKFKSSLEFHTVSFDGLHISVGDLKKAIFHQKRIGKNTDFDLKITNAQTKEDYTDENALIAKNTSLIIARVPLNAQQKRTWERPELPTFNHSKDESNLAKSIDLTRLDGSEDDKIRAMITQSTQDYDPSNYMKIRGSNQVGEVPPHYRCHKCHQPGHWIKNCPLGLNQESVDIKKSTGIPRSFMVPVAGPSVPGAMMTPGGTFAVPAIDHQAYKEGKKEKPPFGCTPEPAAEKPEIPGDLVCTICKDLLTDAVMIPCCGTSFCDDCIRTFLLESEDHECPDCNEKDVSPESLIPNRYLRNAVMNFKNETGYAKRPVFKPAPKPALTAEPTISEKLSATSSMSAATPAQRSAAGLETAEAIEADKPVGKASPSYEKAALEADGDLSAKLTTDDEAEVPPPPGTEPPLLPKRLSDPSWRDSGSESRDGEYSSYHRERRRSFSRENNHRDRNAPYLTLVDNNRHGNRRSSTSPKNNLAHGDYSMHQPPPKVFSEHTRYHPPPMHFDASLRRSAEDRAGTPTVDEPHLHPPPTQPPMMPYPPSDDRSAPPPAGYVPATAPPPPTAPLNPPMMPDPYMAAPRPMPMYAPPPHQQPPPPPPAVYGPPPSAPVPPQRYDARPPPPSYQQPSYRPSQPRGYSGGPPRHPRAYRPQSRPKWDSAGYRGMQPPPPGMNRNMHNGAAGASRSRSPPPIKRRPSRSPPPPHRPRSRTPKKRRSRSGSFTVSRSRSYSRSLSPRGSIPRDRIRKLKRPLRDAPPPYRSPIRSPPRYHKERGREKERQTRDPYSGFYADSGAPGHDYRPDRASRYTSNRGPSATIPVTTTLLPPPGNLIVAAAGPQVPLSAQTQQLPTNLAAPSSLDRKDYYDSYNRYPPSGTAAPGRFAKRYDDVAPPGTEGYYDLPPPGVDHLERPSSAKDRDTPKDKEADRYKDDREHRHRGEDKSSRSSGSRSDREKRERDYDFESKDHRSSSHQRHHHSHESTRHHSSEHPKRSRSSKRSPSPGYGSSSKSYRSSDGGGTASVSTSHKESSPDREAALIQKEAAVLLQQKKEAAAAAVAKAVAAAVADSEPIIRVKEEPKSGDEGSRTAAVTAEPTILKTIAQLSPRPPRVALMIDPATIVKPEPPETPKKVIQAEPAPVEEQAEPSVTLNPSEIEQPIASAEESPSPTGRNASPPPSETIPDSLFEPYEDVPEGSQTPTASEFLAPLPEPSKWERDEAVADKLDDDEDGEASATPDKVPSENDDSKSGKLVTNEVLKRAENAIFQKAINAIRPIEIKKISDSRKILYQNPEPKVMTEPELEREPLRKSVNVTINVNKNERNVEISTETLKKSKSERSKFKGLQLSPTRLSAKERLGDKIDDKVKIRDTVNSDILARGRTKDRRLPISLGSPMLVNPERKVFIADRKRTKSKSRIDPNRPTIDLTLTKDPMRLLDRSEIRKAERAARTPPPLPAVAAVFKARKEAEEQGQLQLQLQKQEGKEDRSKRDKKGVSETKKRKKDRIARSKSRDRKKRKDKKHKKEKTSEHHKRKASKDMTTIVIKDDEEKGSNGSAEVTMASARKNPKLVSDRKRSVIDEVNFEPDYSVSDSESEDDRATLLATKRAKIDDSANLEVETKTSKKKIKVSSSDDSSSSDSSSSDTDSSVESHRKKKRKHKKRKKRKSKKESSSDSDAYSDSSDSSSEEEKHRKKKKSKSKSKQSKKKKKSKHK
ncbi:hypothetical protein QAD02_009014 [Eretmocerus hayati]|uniref:Uncharacterized protein n=1 Tax=Eretmocerus hayati TaxID=131215 RepID=A0ACC2N875_9HYME|nr:hypothetical protein QAD02_009014 [Eretmocerus hayati]